jgi:hypothetical protein
MPARKPTAIIPVDHVQQRILLIRGQRVLLAADLALLFGVPVRRLNEQVRRNADRFPNDFVFQLTKAESETILKSQIATSSWGGARRALPYAFTEHGVVMAANVLRSPAAVKASIFVVRAFVKLRELLGTHAQLASKLTELERKLEKHDDQIIAIIDAIRELMQPPDDPPRKPIGFHTEHLPDPASAKSRKK